MQLSKSDFMMYLRHPAWLWLKKHDRDKLPPPDENLQALFDAGHEFEVYAERRFPEGITLGFDDFKEYQSLTGRTKEALDNGAKTIFQGRFLTGDITCICDVFNRVSNNEFDLYEIKASTKAKPEHTYDLGFQTLVIEGTGYKVRNISVIHINNNYVKDVEIDYLNFTDVTDITDEVRSNLDLTRSRIDDALKVMVNPKRPDISPRHCRMYSLNEWLNIYRGLETIDDYSIYDLATPSKVIGSLEDLEIKKIADIPVGFSLSSKQNLQYVATKQDKRIIDNDKVREFLGTFKYPLYFLDYETAGGTMPPFDGSKPYQQVPFQYSLHVIETPETEVIHKEYLHRSKNNPVKELVSKLRGDIGTSGTIISWNKQFEKNCNNTMKEMYKRFKEADVKEVGEFLDDINARMIDLMEPFSKGWFVDKDFLGSASLKYVLPVVVPELSYDDLAIQEGGSAQRLWMDAVLNDKQDIDKDELFNNLIEYCRLDTLSMVEIWKVISNL